MLNLKSATRVYLTGRATDMIKGFEEFFAVAKTVSEAVPLSRHFCVFYIRTRDRNKVLYFDGYGLWVCAKRLEGIDFDGTNERVGWHRREPVANSG